MEKEKIIFWRNFLFRTFLIGVLFAIILFIAAIDFWNTWVSMVEGIFHTNETDLARLTLSFFLNIRIVLLFIMLAPCVALHWMSKKKN